MSTRDDTELKAYLSRQSAISAVYGQIERAEPPVTLNEKILAAAKVAAKSAPRPAASSATQSAAKSASGPTPTAAPNPPARPAAAARPAPGAGGPGASSPDAAERRRRPRAPKPGADDTAEVARRPAWLVPSFVAVVAVLLVAGGFALFSGSPSGSSDSPLDSSLFARRARERSEESKAAAAAAAEQEAEVVELPPLPPPPVFEPEGPQVEDLDAAIAVIRKELVLANQRAAAQEDAAQPLPGVAAAPATTTPGVIQPRERRLTKILELYDGGNPDLAGDSLEIFLRDFEDDPISQRIVGLKP